MIWQARGRDIHRCAVLDQERGQGVRPRDVVDKEGQRLVFWHEGACRRRCTERYRAQPGHQHGQGT